MEFFFCMCLLLTAFTWIEGLSVSAVKPYLSAKICEHILLVFFVFSGILYNNRVDAEVGTTSGKYVNFGRDL